MSKLEDFADDFPKLNFFLAFVVSMGILSGASLFAIPYFPEGMSDYALIGGMVGTLIAFMIAWYMALKRDVKIIVAFMLILAIGGYYYLYYFTVIGEADLETVFKTFAKDGKTLIENEFK